MEIGIALDEESQAEINALFGEGTSQPTEPEASADEKEEVAEVDEESKEASPDGESDEVETEASDSEEGEPQTPEADIEYIKADGKKVKIDYSDRDNIKRVFSLAAGARKWQVERDDLQSKYDGLSQKHEELSQIVDYLDSNKANHEEIFEAITGVSLNDKFRIWAEEQDMLSGMTDTEKSLYLSNQDHQKRMQEVERREKALQAKLEKYNEEAEKVESSRQASLANPVFHKYNFDKELGNPQLELRMNRTLWNEAKAELSQYSEVTPAMLEETFKRISNQIRAGFKTSADKSVKKAVKNNRKAVKEKAQKMAVAPKKANKKQEIDDKIKQGDIAGLFGMDLSDY